MRTSWKLGQVAGIDCYVHPLLLLVLGLVAMNGGGLLSLLLVVAAFGCVLLHELGHALMARRFGIETEDITLYPIGGVARLRRMPRAPGVEIAIALAGPAVNLAIAGGLVLFLLASPLVEGFGALQALAFNLLIVNAFLAGFNLIPAFPMDGGRVFRALLSGWLGRVRATSIAATVGRALALIYGGYSLGLALTMSDPSRWIQVFLAAFIYFAAGAELRAVQAEERRRNAAEGIWTAPAGFHWVKRGNGLWQLAPITVQAGSRPGSPWR